MSCIAVDVVAIKRILGVGVSPLPSSSGVISAYPGTLVLSAIINDPNSESPYTYLWEKTDSSSLTFTDPTAAVTTVGTLVSGDSYALKLTVTTARLTTVSFAFTISVL